MRNLVIHCIGIENISYTIIIRLDDSYIDEVIKSFINNFEEIVSMEDGNEKLNKIIELLKPLDGLVFDTSDAYSLESLVEEGCIYFSGIKECNWVIF